MRGKTIHVFVLDMESRDGLKRTGVVVCGIKKIGVIDDYGFYEKDEKVEFFVDFEDWLKGRKEKNMLIYVYNLGFDYLTFHEMKGEKEFEFRGSEAVSVKITTQNKNIEVRDFALITNKISLEELSSVILNEHKVVIEDWINVDMKKLVERVEKDVILTSKLILFFYDFFKRLFDINIFNYKTIAGISFSIFNKFMPEEYKNPFRFVRKGQTIRKNEDVEQVVKRSYYGGRVENFEFYYRGTVFEHDINSLYPFVMSKFYYPNRFLFKRKISTVEELKSLMKDYEGVVEGVFVVKKNNYYGLPQKIDARLVFKCGRVQTAVNFPELRFLVENDLLEAVEGTVYAFSRMRFDERFFKELYKKRKENAVFNIIFKLILNSCYGHFGLKDETELVYQIDGQVYREKKETVLMRQNYLIAGYITSYGRFVLHTYMREVEKAGGRIFYCDTDSIHTNIILRQYIGNELGQLKCEEYENGVWIAPKLYKIGDKVRSKGFFEGEFERIIQGEEISREIYTKIKTLLNTGKYFYVQKRSFKQKIFKRKVEGDRLLMWSDEEPQEQDISHIIQNILKG